jgi:lycopene cyclase domain-containing protein
MSSTSFAYMLFHFVIVGSLVLSYKLYPKMLFPTQKEMVRMLPVSLFFIIWDYFVTDIWWHFNSDFILFESFAKQFRLPLEEILFFFVVPFALLTFLKNILQYTQKSTFLLEKNMFSVNVFVVRLLLFTLAFIFFYQQQWYSFTIVVLLQFVEYSLLLVKSVSFGLLFTLCTTFIFNLYLTYLPIVTYTQSYKTGYMVGTIPIEDFGYAIILYLMLVKATNVSK